MDAALLVVDGLLRPFVKRIGEDVKAVLRAMLWPLAFVALVMHDCFNVFWYCVIVGRPAWIRDHKNPVQEMAELFGRMK